MTSRSLATYGAHGKRVRVFVEGGRVWAIWRTQGVREKKSWPDTRKDRVEAKAWAEAFATARARVERPRELIRTDELWRRYISAEWPLLRPKTRKIYSDYWRRWQVFVGPERIAEDLGPGTMAEYRTHLDRTLGPSTVHRHLQVVKTVYNWGYVHEHLGQNRVRDFRYKVAKEKRPEKIPEFTPEEFAAILAQLPLTKATTWRAGGVLALCGLQGSRVNAVLHLRWEDIDLQAGTIRWQPEWDKQGRDETSPMRPRARAVLEAIRPWTKGEGWLFPSGSSLSKREIYSVQSLLVSLHAAEGRANIGSVKKRGAHSLRRMLFNDVLHVTGDIGAAMAAIRDTSLQVASKYVREREQKVREAFEALDTNGPQTTRRNVSRETGVLEGFEVGDGGASA